METEEWRDVPGYEGLYQVSDLGRVKSLYREVPIKNFIRKVGEHIMNPCLSRGYLLVNLHKDLKQRVLKVHQLVAMTFLGHTRCGSKLVVDHVNGITTDNNVFNLRIVTQRENNSICFRKNASKYTSRYVGVSWINRKNKWLSGIKINGENKYLGMFHSEQDASAAYQKALSEITGADEILSSCI